MEDKKKTSDLIDDLIDFCTKTAYSVGIYCSRPNGFSNHQTRRFYTNAAAGRAWAVANI